MSVGRSRLVINADDLGLARSVNRGIIEAAESGVVTSASLMVNMAATADAIVQLSKARDRGVRVAIGLHFNIVAGAPLASCASLQQAHGGEFHGLFPLALRAFTGRVDPSDVELELDAQLRRAGELLAPLGMVVTHIDSHRHAHCLPGVSDVVRRVANARGVRHVRHPVEKSLPGPRKLPASLAMWLLRAVLPEHARLDEIHFAGFALMNSHTLDRDFAALVASLPPGDTELMVHPGYDSAELARLDAYRAPRERELRALTSPALRRQLQELGVELIDFGSRDGLAPQAIQRAREAF